MLRIRTVLQLQLVPELLMHGLMSLLDEVQQAVLIFNELRT